MKKERPAGKTRITIRLDGDVLAWFRDQVRPGGGSYQTLINSSLRDYIAREPLEAMLRRVIRAELARASGASPESADAYGPLPAALVADADRESGEYGRRPSAPEGSLRARARRMEKPRSAGRSRPAVRSGDENE